MGDVMRAGSLILLFGLVAWPSMGVAAASAPSGCGPAPSALDNPPEMIRVEGRIQSIELEARQDGDRLCFVERGNIDRPGIAPTIRIRPGETLRVRLFNGISDASVLRKTTPPGHATSAAGVAAMAEYFDVVSGAYHEPTGNTNLHFHGLEVKPVPPRISFPRAGRRRGAPARAPMRSPYRTISLPDSTGTTRISTARAKPRPCSDCRARS
jgi:FtsP/CotA-like multicopper oxidase with cupredoxin domain